MKQQSDNETLIRCESVSKVFCLNLKKSMWYGAQDIFRAMRIGSQYSNRSKIVSAEARPLRGGEFWANKDINFAVKRGECLGLIGRNGAGKTTLLKMLNGIIRPDTGRIFIKGRMGSLIALGAGFNPILTGRENIVANAMVLGLSPKQIRDRVDEIIDFADLRDFIDSPVRNYSSGMQVRLGFAIATVINPDILILDEVLAVGDASFRHKCYSRINKLMKDSAVILVSHSMDYIGQLATSVGVMNRGELKLFSDPQDGIASYNELTTSLEHSQDADGGTVKAHYPPVETVEIVVPSEVHYGEELEVRVRIQLSEDTPDANLSFILINRNEQSVACFHTGNNEKRISLSKGFQEIRFRVEKLWLHQGDYKWSLDMSRQGSIEHIVWHMRAGNISVVRSGRPIGDIPYLPDPLNLNVIKFS